MEPVLALAYRNMLIYFRDRQSVLFSLMGVLVVVMLYLLFLRTMLIDSFPGYDGMDGLIDAWVLSGILGIVPVTTCAGCLQPMVGDRAAGRDRDILVTPMTPRQIAGGWIIGTFAVGCIMSVVTLAISVAYLAATGCPLSTIGILGCIVLIVPSSLSASAIMYALSCRMGSTGAFSGLFVVISVLIGFLAGIYMPMGTMPDAMQVIGTLVPASHMAALFRDALASDAFDHVFTGASADEITDFRHDMGFDLDLNGFVFGHEAMLAYVLAVSALFFIVTAIGMRRRT